MAEPCLALPRPIGVALRVFRDIGQIQRCGLDALTGQPVRQMVDARGIVESIAIFASFGAYGGIDILSRAIKTIFAPRPRRADICIMSVVAVVQ